MSVVNFQQNTALPLKHERSTEPSEPSAYLIGVQSKEDTERLWKKRLNLYLNAEQNLLKVGRVRNITSIVATLSVSLLLFSLYMSPTLTPLLFFTLSIVSALGIAIYPVCVLISNECQKKRDNISRMFYQSNHELEIVDGKVTLINRSNYTNVTHVHILDRYSGQFAT
ncbi:hypothetical protein Q4561_14210 [Alteromonas sp. 1_MG-2023]|uniref:hypothetical protein n=1 Tax=Alteromonas sp. 1_MG-2023 TaxID=3062669 RepID=UPI0026E218E5|nr:hypothetical protein [Alteromonas sp. 1_MG-2023]MDO6568222.1 hypothetical protein [Alteromonas sp. 1_MG-2023]